MKLLSVGLLLLVAAIASAELLPSSEYLPPVQDISVQSFAPSYQQIDSIPSYGVPSNEYLAPLGPSPAFAQYSSGALADDGYRYKTVKRFRTAKRLRSRHRRDVNELPSSEYLPPVSGGISYQSAPQVSYQQYQPSLGLPSSEYLAPLGSSSFGIPSNEYLAPIGPSPAFAQYSSGALADDGYRYKTVKRFRTAKRLRSRHRRDVNELPSSEYLPPVSGGISYQSAPQVSYQQYQPSLGLPSSEYLAPLGSSSFGIPSNEYLAPLGPSPAVAQYSSGVLADDGYRYKTVKRFRTAKRLRSRHRRDVSELPSSEYLPPVSGGISYQSAPQVSYQQYQPSLSGFSYQSAPQVSYEQYQPSLSIPSNEYLAPLGPSPAVAQYSSGVLADDGYRYKTVKRFRTAKRYRSRH